MRRAAFNECSGGFKVCCGLHTCLRLLVAAMLAALDFKGLV